MIDAREGLVSAPSSQSQRRNIRSRNERLNSRSTPNARKLKVQRVFSDAKVKPFDQVEWEKRTAEITDDSGKVIFKQEGVEVPKSWSILATKVVVSKYFYGEQNTGERETSVQQLIHRVARTIADWGVKDGYFSKEDGEVFYEELAWLCLNQYGAFNSPVWFNVGLYHEYGVGKDSAKGNWYFNRKAEEAQRAPTQYEYPQGSACFIQSVEDDLVNEGGIMDLWVREARLFKYGSGTGSNFSYLRGEGEKLSGGGRSSGLMSFLKIGDRAAGAIKSGGTTRRAAKMVVVDIDHPDIEDYIDWKVKEEQKVASLVTGSKIVRNHLAAIMKACVNCEGDNGDCFDPEKNPALKREIRAAKKNAVPESIVKRVIQFARQGYTSIDFKTYDTDWDSEAYLTVSGQNSNNSVRIPNRFFKAVEEDADWDEQGFGDWDGRAMPELITRYGEDLGLGRHGPLPRQPRPRVRLPRRAPRSPRGGRWARRRR